MDGRVGGRLKHGGCWNCSGRRPAKLIVHAPSSMSLSKSCLSTEVVDSRLVIRDWYVPSCAVIREPITSAGFLVVDVREASPSATVNVGYTAGGDMVRVERNTATIVKQSGC